MKSLAAVLLASFSLSAAAYNLTEKECYSGGNITARAAMQRDSGKAKEKLLAEAEAYKGQYNREELYDLVLRIVEDVYNMPEVSPGELGEQFVDECVTTRGVMNSRM